jgi:cation transport protein ChaC
MSGTGTRWVFAYGSLIWNPGFDFIRALPSWLRGYHRKLCVYSFHYRGTPDQPGLVFGLDRGGSCQGVAYEVEERLWPGIHDYLTRRELITQVYKEAFKPVSPAGLAAPVNALTYVVDRSHPQCACNLGEEDIVRLVKQGHGEAGRNIDYVLSTQRKLAELGIGDPALERIAARLVT